jgi:hypothetical protein
MMSGVPLEICQAFNKRGNNKFYYKVASCWIFILRHTAMHGSMNIKFSLIIYSDLCDLMVILTIHVIPHILIRHNIRNW